MDDFYVRSDEEYAPVELKMSLMEEIVLTGLVWVIELSIMFGIFYYIILPVIKHGWQ